MYPKYGHLVEDQRHYQSKHRGGAKNSKFRCYIDRAIQIFDLFSLRKIFLKLEVSNFTVKLKTYAFFGYTPGHIGLVTGHDLHTSALSVMGHLECPLTRGARPRSNDTVEDILKY